MWLSSLNLWENPRILKIAYRYERLVYTVIVEMTRECFTDV